MSSNPILRIKIDNKSSLDLFEFTNAMIALNNQYHSLISSKSNKEEATNHKLYINQISNGSIIIDLCVLAHPLLNFITNHIDEFAYFLVSVWDYLIGDISILPYNLSIKDWTDHKKILEIVSSFNGNIFSLITINCNSNINKSYSSIEANAAQNQCDKEIKKLQSFQVNVIKEKVELKLYQMRNSNLSISLQGNMGIIPEINPKPKVLSFANDRIRYDITKAEENPFNCVYNVDVEIHLKDEKKDFLDHKNIKEYEILKIHGIVEEFQSDMFEDALLEE